MNIAEAERRTGLSRANHAIGLLPEPPRGENGYRDYTEDNVQTLRKIMLLRRLRLSVPDIRAIESGEKALPEAAAGQLDVLQGDIRESEQSGVERAGCRPVPVHRAARRRPARERPHPAGRLSVAALLCPQCGCRTVWTAVVDAVAVGVPHQSG